MESATAGPDPVDDDVRMGSEYASARDYLGRTPRGERAKPKSASPTDPRHGSNDSDFGVPPDAADGPAE